jgi:lipopolysaccharide cholinephosphotransferase
MNTLITGLFIVIIFVIIMGLVLTDIGKSILNPKKPEITKTDQETTNKLYKIMREVSVILTDQKIPFWIEGGTLLGAVRHGGLIPWDDDLDIQILDSDKNRLEAILPVLKKHGYDLSTADFGYKIFSMNGEPTEFNFKFPFIDVFLVDIDKRDETMRYSTEMAQRVWGKCYHDLKDVFPLKPYRFGLDFVPGPNNPYPILDRCYGTDWRTHAYMETNHKESKPRNREKFRLTYEEIIPLFPTDV